MKTPRVVHIIDSLQVGGAETLAVNIANALNIKDVFSVLCVTRREGALKESISDHTPYYFLNRKRVVDFSAIRMALKLIKTHKISIVHAHSSSLYFTFMLKLLRPQIKIVWHDHYGRDLNKRKSIAIKICSLGVWKIISVNNDLKNWARKKLFCKNVYYLANFADLHKTNQLTILNGDVDKRIVHIAGFRAQKNHLNLLKAFLLVRKSHSDWTLHLIGKEYNDAYSMQIHDFIEQNNLSNSVFIYGQRKDIGYILSQSSIGVLSSDSEGLPISLLEYGLAGIPAVSTDVGQCKDVIQTPELLVPPKNEERLSDSIQLLINNKDVYDRERRKISTNVKEKYSKERFMNTLQKIYLNL